MWILIFVTFIVFSSLCLFFGVKKFLKGRGRAKVVGIGLLAFGILGIVECINYFVKGKAKVLELVVILAIDFFPTALFLWFAYLTIKRRGFVWKVIGLMCLIFALYFTWVVFMLGAIFKNG